MYKKSFILFAFLLSSNVFALPILGGGGDSDGKDGSSSSSGGKSGPLSGLIENGELLSVLKTLPLRAGLNGLVGDVVKLVRTLLEKVIIILEELIPSLSTKQLNELTELLKNEEMTKSEILETIDNWVKGQPIKTQELYQSIVKDLDDKINATFETLKDIAYDISPEVGQLIEKLGDIVLNDVLTLLQEDKEIGNLFSNLLKNVDQLLKDLLKDLDRLLSSLLKTLDLEKLLNLNGLLKLDGLLQDGLLGSLLGENSVVNKLLDSLLGGLLGGGKKDGLLGLGVLGILKK